MSNSKQTLKNASAEGLKRIIGEYLETYAVFGFDSNGDVRIMIESSTHKEAFALKGLLEVADQYHNEDIAKYE